MADVQEASQDFLALDRLVTVLVGDARIIQTAVEALDPVEVVAEDIPET